MKCEACENKATRFDREGVPLCQSCFEALDPSICEMCGLKASTNMDDICQDCVKAKKENP